MRSKILSEPILVGREKELAQLNHYLKHATEGKGTTILVSGEAGTGKTRLINTFLKKVRNKDIIVLSGWCLAEVRAPYFPFIEAFNSYYVHDHKKEQSLIPKKTRYKSGIGVNFEKTDIESEMSSNTIGSNFLEKIFHSNSSSPQIWKDQVFAAVTNQLFSMVSTKPLILFIEDMHWADSASIALFHYISRSIKQSERIMLLGTFRSEDLTADSDGRPHPLAEVMRMMRRENLYDEIKLPSLCQADVERIAEDMIGGNLQPQLKEKLAFDSKGNPLFVVESLRMLHERQSLNFENNQWSIAVTELGLPSKIKDIILRRLAVLKFSQRRVLDAASVIGEKFDVELLSAVLGVDYLEVLETLNIIAQTTRLVSVEANYFKFDHERSRQSLYEELALPLKQGYHAKIAEKLESTTASALPLSDLAYHYSKAGNKEKAIKFSLVAAKDELAKFSNQQAIQHFKYVLQNTKKDDDEQRNIALEGLGDAYLGNSMYAEAIKTFNELAFSNSGLVRLRALRKATDAAFHKWDEPDLLIEYAEKAEKLASFDRLEMGRVLNNRGRAFAAAMRGDLRQDLADYNAALQIFEEENSLADVADALWRSGIITSLFNTKEGLNRILRSVAIFREIGDVRREAEATLIAGQVFYGIGLFSEAKWRYLFVLSKCEKLGMFSELSMASNGLSSIYEHEKNLEEALVHSLKSNEYSKKTDAKAAPNYYSLLRIYSKLGDAENAENVFKLMMKNEQLLSKVDTIKGTEMFNLFSPSKAVYLTFKDQLEEASKIFENHIKIFNTPRSFVGIEDRVREDYALLLEKMGQMEKAKAQREKINILLKKVNENWKHANVFLSVMAPSKVFIGDKFEIRLDLVNVGNSTAVLTKIEGLASPEIKIDCPQSFCNLRSNELEINSKKVDSFKVVTIKLKAQATKQATFTLNPEITYLNDLDEIKKFKARKVTIKAEKPKPTYKILPGRITTGSNTLDELLLGGIPKEYAVVLSGPPCDERELLIKNFLKAGSNEDITFHISTEAIGLEDLLENPNFYLFLCNPKPKNRVPNLPNVFKLQSKADITNLGIALTKAYRSIDKSSNMKRLCVEILSDVLVKHGTNTTREWISGLITDLGAKGFTMLAVMNPAMHPSDQANAILDLLDGEIRITQSDDPLDCKKSILVKKLRNQDYIKNPICLR